MKEIIRFNETGRLTFFKRPIVVQKQKDGIILPMLGLISIAASIFWDDIEKWLTKKKL
jgi:hypothetical protein